MRKYRGSHEDFDYFVIPTVPALKQQQDTIATLAELARIGIPASKLRIVFNQVEDGADVCEDLRARAVLRRAASLSPRPRTRAGWAPTRSTSESRASGTEPGDAGDGRDRLQGARSPARKDTAEKVALAQKLATRRLASGVVPELDDCFAALELSDADGIDHGPPSDTREALIAEALGDIRQGAGSHRRGEADAREELRRRWSSTADRLLGSLEPFQKRMVRIGGQDPGPDVGEDRRAGQPSTPQDRSTPRSAR